MTEKRVQSYPTGALSTEHGGDLNTRVTAFSEIGLGPPVQLNAPYLATHNSSISATGSPAWAKYRKCRYGIRR